MFESEPIRHPDDDVERDERGPWLGIFVVAALVWVVLALVEWRFLAEGTFLWATVKSLSTLVLAPLAAAALVQDTRALGVSGFDVGPLRWLYAAVALFFPPITGVYLCHRHLVVGRRAAATD